MTNGCAISLHAGYPRDIAEVDALMATAFDARFGEAWTHGQVLGVLAMPGVRLTLARTDDVPAGFALVRQVLDEAELLLLAVDPAFRRRGIGGALMRQVIADAQAGGVAMVHLEVRADNKASRLYTRHGFAKVAERRGYYRGSDGTVRDAHSYRRMLTPA
ncbi:ribosomal-protein-alanine N-acetyltransferase [Sphingomonas gellani]|uniref:Ribosomal-protein-alanine N-acetyltransferase n=1 Tax=Sphingomonas gellani TaxID=1166340 RepID=A0A1H8FVS2_9SPHN|nr:ribosomal protein S18-alanine N-acetyltransferase [Sphingomonas gellani]SEN35367.1 ribosomal-protein-alanine N-acetyltransferase [Sphingomonas gellani]